MVFSAAAEALTPEWTVKVFRNGQLQSTYVNDGQYGTTKLKPIVSFEAPVGAIESWTIVATTVPEPGSMVAMLSGLVGLVGYGIRRRK